MRRLNMLLVALLAAALTVSCGHGWSMSTEPVVLELGEGQTLELLPYPAARRQELVENHHGASVAAPYRWLEDDHSAETGSWTVGENRVTQDFLNKTGLQEPLRKRLAELWNYPRFSAPAKRGNRYFFSKNDGLQNQSVLYVREGLDGEAKVVIDPNTLSEDGTTALSAAYLSRDGSLMAYGISVHGSDRQEFRIREVETGKDYDEVIKWCKFSGMAWRKDGSGFFYNRFPEPGSVDEEDENNYNRVYWHKLGTPQSEDALIFEMPEEKELGFHPHISDDGTYLILSVYHGTDPRSGLFYVSLREDKVPAKGDFVRMLPPGQAAYNFVENDGEVFFVHTDRNAPRGEIIAVDTRSPVEKYWRRPVPEHDKRVISSASYVKGKLIVNYMEDAHTVLVVCEPGVADCAQVPLPGIGSVRGLSTRKDDGEIFFAYTSFLQPSVIYRYDVDSGEMSVFQDAPHPFDASGYETKQLFFASKDGTEVPMFLTHKKGLEPTGDTPVLLYGYGGFNINLTPYFSTSRLVFLEAGGAYALINLRGGSEYGEDWHRAGMLENKQNVFDDFIAAAEHLVETKFTRPDRIAILGGSNGGLLVSACMLQRPDLFGAVVAAVPVTDMLRYHKFTVGRYWVPEYGDPGKPDDFKFLYAYSPLHNVEAGENYPPILVTTADTDDRVVPAHSRKFVAELQARAGRENPALIRIETKAGHGAGKPTSKKIEEAADMYAFMFFFLGMSLP